MKGGELATLYDQWFERPPSQNSRQTSTDEVAEIGFCMSSDKSAEAYQENK